MCGFGGQRLTLGVFLNCSHFIHQGKNSWTQSLMIWLVLANHFALGISCLYFSCAGDLNSGPPHTLKCWAFTPAPPLYFLRQDLSMNLELTDWLDWMAEVFLWVLLSVVPGVTCVHYHIQLLYGCWGLNSDLAWVSPDSVRKFVSKNKIRGAVAIVQE